MDKTGLNDKIAEAIKQNESDMFLKQIQKIFYRYSNIINDFSHGFTKMISPYLMTNIVDIAKLEYEIKELSINEN